MKRPSQLIRHLRKLLGSELDAFRPDGTLSDDKAWERWYRGLVERSIRLGREVRRNRARMRKYYSDFDKAPPGRQAFMLSNSPPPMLIALAHELIDRSYDSRFEDPERSLSLAELALEVVDALDQRTLADEIRADLRAEAWGHLANARRITSDLAGAGEAFQASSKYLAEGTGDRHLKARLLGLRSALEFSKGDAKSAAALMDREIRLWRLLDQRERVGEALFDRAIVASWIGTTEEALGLIKKAERFSSDAGRSSLALSALAERYARDGNGSKAWRLVCARDMIILRVFGDQEPPMLRRFQWVTGLAHFAMGEMEEAQAELQEAREGLIEEQRALASALVSLDLAALHAARGDHGRVKELAEQAYAIFRAEGLEQRALAAFQVLYEAAQAEEATAELTVRVANFVVRSQYDRSLQFSARTTAD